MEISNEKFGMLLKEAASEAGRRRGISVAHTLIDEGVVGSTSALSWLYNGQSKDDEKYVTVMVKIIDLLPSWRKEHYYSEIGKIVLGRETKGQEGQGAGTWTVYTCQDLLLRWRDMACNHDRNGSGERPLPRQTTDGVL